MGGFLFAPAPSLGLPTSAHACADVWDHVIPVNHERGGRNFFKKGLYFLRLVADNPYTQGAQPPLPDTENMTTTTNRRYYAMQWHHYAVDGNTGKRCAAYYSFPRRATRDAWVEDGAPYLGSGSREALPASDSELRAELRRDRAEGHCGLRVEHMG
jgi:hypothetical protein